MTVIVCASQVLLFGLIRNNLTIMYGITNFIISFRFAITLCFQSLKHNNYVRAVHTSLPIKLKFHPSPTEYTYFVRMTVTISAII